MSLHDVELETFVRVEVNDPLVIRRPVENIDNWRGDLYDLRTEDDVLEHLAYNCIWNGIERVNRLDGWADLADDAATMELIDAGPA